VAQQITNKHLSQLLVNLGFERGEVTEKHRVVWRHARAGTVVLLPANKLQETPLPADIVSLRTHLHHQGHLAESEFDQWMREGTLPVGARD
jgi:hypothetical protein